jgi:hypothetical protein
MAFDFFGSSLQLTREGVQSPEDAIHHYMMLPKTTPSKAQPKVTDKLECSKNDEWEGSSCVYNTKRLI